VRTRIVSAADAIGVRLLPAARLASVGLGTAMSVETKRGDTVTVICPNLSCRRTLSAPASARGKVLRCGFCSVVFRVPANQPVQSGPGGKAETEGGKR